MARRRVTSSVTRCGAEAPQLYSIIPPGLGLRPGVGLSGHPRKDDPTGCRRESWDGDRFAPRPRMQGRRKGLHRGLGGHRDHRVEGSVRGLVKKLDVVQDRVTSPDTRVDVGSNPTWSIRKAGGLKTVATWASSSMDRAPDVPGRMFPSSSFLQRKEVLPWKK